MGILKYILQKIGDSVIFLATILGIITALISIVAAGSGDNPIDVFVNIVQGDIEIRVLSDDDRRVIEKFERLLDDEAQKRGL